MAEIEFGDIDGL